MRILKFIPVILIILSACNSNEEFKLNEQAQAIFDAEIERSRISQEQMSKHIDSIAYEIDQRAMDELLVKAKKYKLNSGSNCSCVNTFSITNTNEITLQDKEHEQIKFKITKSSNGATFTISGTDTAAYYKPNNRIEFLDDKSKTIRMFNHFTKHRQKSMTLICDENDNFENLAKLKLLQNRNIVAISINCLNSMNKDIELTAEESKMLRCILNCN